jgi:hypothetical protein
LQINQQKKKNFNIVTHQGGPIKEVALVKICCHIPSYLPLSPHGTARLFPSYESKDRELICVIYQYTSTLISTLEQSTLAAY